MIKFFQSDKGIESKSSSTKLTFKEEVDHPPFMQKVENPNSIEVIFH